MPTPLPHRTPLRRAPSPSLPPPDPRTRAVLDALFPVKRVPGHRVYAIVDGARDPRVHPLVTAEGVASACLFRGELSDVLAQASPWLVALDGPTGLARTLVELGWGGSWGVFVETGLDLEGTRRHLRRFLRAKLEGGPTVLFRWWDPRIARVYLPTMNADETRFVMGPLHRFAVEDEDGGALLSHRHTDWQIGVERVALPAGTH